MLVNILQKASVRRYEGYAGFIKQIYLQKTLPTIKVDSAFLFE